MPKLHFNAKDLTGLRFGRLKVIKLVVDKRIRGNLVWTCLCNCGQIKDIKAGNLQSGVTQSCRCLNFDRSREKNTKHGARYTPEWLAWKAMRERCRRKGHVQYEDYGGRGIKVCARWNSFENFLTDMGKRPSDKHSLDRYPNNDGDYEPTNCRWATAKQQANNRRPKRKRVVK